MRILLAVVPQCEVAAHPLLALPALAGNLAFNGYHDVEQADFSKAKEVVAEKPTAKLAPLAPVPEGADDGGVNEEPPVQR